MFKGLFIFLKIQAVAAQNILSRWICVSLGQRRLTVGEILHLKTYQMTISSQNRPHSKSSHYEILLRGGLVLITTGYQSRNNEITKNFSLNWGKKHGNIVCGGAGAFIWPFTVPYICFITISCLVTDIPYLPVKTAQKLKIHNTLVNCDYEAKKIPSNKCSTRMLSSIVPKGSSLFLCVLAIAKAKWKKNKQTTFVPSRCGCHGDKLHFFWKPTLTVGQKLFYSCSFINNNCMVFLATSGR